MDFVAIISEFLAIFNVTIGQILEAVISFIPETF